MTQVTTPMWTICAYCFSARRGRDIDLLIVPGHDGEWNMRRLTYKG